MKLEADYKRDIAKAARKAGGYARRIEDKFAVGILDMVLIFNDTGPVFVEVKRVKNGKFGPTPRQLQEMKDVEAAGGKTCCIGCDGNTFYIEFLPHQFVGRELTYEVKNALPITKEDLITKFRIANGG